MIDASGVAHDWSFPRVDSLPAYPFVVTDAAKARARAAGVDIIDLSLGNPDRPTPPAIVAELERAARVGENHRYHPGRGLPALREAAGRWWERRYGARFDREREIIVTMGAKEGISHLCLAILDRGDVVVVPDPCYPIHAGAPGIAGAEVEYYPSGASDPASAIAYALERVRARGQRAKLVIVNYPQNPTGLTLSRDELQAVVRVVEQSGAFLLSDLAYADLDFGVRHAPSIFDCGFPLERVRACAVEVFTVSKSYNMPGWRVAFMVGNERLVSALGHLKTYLDYGTFAPLQHAAAWALDHGDAISEEIRELYRGRAQALVSGLRGLGFPDVREPSGTMFVWTKLPESLAKHGSIAAATRLIESAGVAVSPGIGFGPGGEGFARFALIEDAPRIHEACRRLGEVLGRSVEGDSPRFRTLPSPHGSPPPQS